MIYARYFFRSRQTPVFGFHKTSTAYKRRRKNLFDVYVLEKLQRNIANIFAAARVVFAFGKKKYA